MTTKRGFLTHLFIISGICLSLVAGAKAQTAEDFWAMKPGNSWTYNGSNLSCTPFPCSWTWRTDVVRTDLALILPGFTTYYVEEFAEGLLEGKVWYAINTSEMRMLRREIFKSSLGRWITITVDGGLSEGANPIAVGASWSEGPVSGTFDGAPVTATTQNTVMSQEIITVPSGAYTAYRIHHVLTVPELGGVVDDRTQWFVPSLGVIKNEYTTRGAPGDIDTEVLASMWQHCHH